MPPLLLALLWLTTRAAARPHPQAVAAVPLPPALSHTQILRCQARGDADLRLLVLGSGGVWLYRDGAWSLQVPGAEHSASVDGTPALTWARWRPDGGGAEAGTVDFDGGATAHPLASLSNTNTAIATAPDGTLLVAYHTHLALEQIDAAGQSIRAARTPTGIDATWIEADAQSTSALVSGTHGVQWVDLVDHTAVPLAREGYVYLARMDASAEGAVVMEVDTDRPVQKVSRTGEVLWTEPAPTGAGRALVRLPRSWLVVRDDGITELSDRHGRVRAQVAAAGMVPQRGDLISACGDGRLALLPQNGDGIEIWRWGQ